MKFFEKTTEDLPQTEPTPEELKRSPIAIPAWIRQSEKHATPEEKTEWRKFGKYLPQVRQIFKDHGIPDELVYLAYTESCCDPTAVNGEAVGIFQLKESTAERLGLKVVPNYIDERKSVLRAAETTAKILSEIYDLTLAWSWAILGFNLGKEGVQKQYEKYRGDVKAYLESQDATEEQKNYLHKFFTAREIFRNMGETEPQAPQLESAHIVYKRQKKPITYVVKEGDTLTSISLAHNKTVAGLIAFNLQKDPEFNPDNLSINQEILIPQIPVATLKYSTVTNNLAISKRDFDELNPHLGPDITRDKKGIPETTIYFPAGQNLKNFFYDSFEEEILDESAAEEEVCEREVCFEEARRRY
ncbi:MAG: hypothetical protein ACD_65C00128G0008 [uncultured bacterium]|nr:MAG: hypothetical protein ACD_65C00128G0008 [uncultured bacterium]KKT02985.1 MAG: membrane-bound lytic murein transglycosylase [Candidatus Peregrinibacteria bacterium GW2011_GWF2_43_17]HAU40329.1 hypothetical protein [Candidatus Peregrinibacteria bacterium]